MSIKGKIAAPFGFIGSKVGLRTGGEDSWPAKVEILKPTKNEPMIEETRGRRMDEREDKNSMVADSVRFELKSGGITAPIPYSQIYQTNNGPKIYLISPEKGTFIPANMGLYGIPQDVIENPEDYLEETDLEEVEADEWVDLTPEDIKEVFPNLEAQLEAAVDNQNWLRWGKQTVLDMKLSWETETGWLERHGAKIVIAVAALANVAAVVMFYMIARDMTGTIKELNGLAIPLLTLLGQRGE